MKFLIELNPPAEAKNEFEKSPELQRKVGEALEKMRPLAAWFTLRYGFIVVEAESNMDLGRKVAPLFHLFKTDIKVSPAYSAEEFPQLVAAIGEEAKHYE
ncbi:MAG: hypothetical protein ACE5IJ_10420 [Thermoplasmata archaeon]